MIGFNGTYLDKASLGNVRITAAAIGGKWVIDNRYLTSATQQAIIAAFGSEEGKAVISKTNDYLNAIALTDTERAQQLAMFINEDPMLVCSLVETSKERWLVTDGFACIQTKTILNGDSNITSICMVPKNLAGNQTLWCARETTNANTYTAFLLGTSIRSDYASAQSATGRDMPREQSTELRTYESDFYLNGEMLVDRSVLSFSTANGVSLFASYSTAGTAPYTNVQSGFKQGIFKVEQGEELVLHLAPFTRNGENGMLDILSGTFHPNANTEGTFTITLTDKA